MLRSAAILSMLVALAPRHDPAIAADKFDIDFAHSEIGFSIRFMGLTNVRGRFTQYAGTIMYVEKDLPRSTVSVLIQAKSIDTGMEFRDKDLRGPSFFNVDSFPTILFRSTGLERTDDGFVAQGQHLRQSRRSVSRQGRPCERPHELREGSGAERR